MTYRFLLTLIADNEGGPWSPWRMFADEDERSLKGGMNCPPVDGMAYQFRGPTGDLEGEAWMTTVWVEGRTINSMPPATPTEGSE